MRKTGDKTPNRRQFLQGLGLGLLGGGLTGCHGPVEDPYALTKPDVPGAAATRRGEESIVSTACGQCPAGCGIEVRVHEGRAVSISGAEENPINSGGIGPRGLSGLQVLYDPDRITQPLLRKGSRGNPEFEPISWDDAIFKLSERLSGLREAGEPHRLGVVSGRHRGLMLGLMRRFARSYGTPNVFDGLSKHHAALVQAMQLTQGVREIPTYDWSSTRYVLSLGAGILESSCQMVYFTRSAARMRRGRDTQRAKIVQVEPSLSKTAAQADEWISIAPGTHAAFALGLAHVLVREDLHDADFITDHCFGFEDWTDENGNGRPGFREVLMRDYSPEAVARACGVEASTIERLAREISVQAPAVVAIDERATLATNGLQTALAAQTLNALLGAIDRPGGVLSSRSAPVGNWPEPELDAAAEAGLAHPRIDGAGQAGHLLAESSLESLPEALLAGKPYELDTLLLHYSNPVHSGLSPKRWREALAKVPFIASFSPFMDETVSEFADLVLPDHSYLERWEDAAPAPSTGYAVFGVRQPAVKPLHDTRHSGDVLLDLGREMGGPVGEALDWKSFRTLLFDAFKELHRLRRGTINEKKYKSFGRELLSSGFWAEPGYDYERWEEVLRTPSGRFEFYSQELDRALAARAERTGQSVESLLAGMSLTPDAHLACLPHHEPVLWTGSPEDFPVVLEPYTPSTHAEGSGANLPLLQELRSVRGRLPWRTTADLAPETGELHGLSSGDEVEVSSPHGTVRLHVHLRPGMRPGILRVPRGGGHEALGRWAAGWGANVNELLAPVTEPLGGSPALLGTRVALRRIG
jgi:anaerobic selenocysteine-containing dehydrogenase